MRFWSLAWQILRLIGALKVAGVSLGKGRVSCCVALLLAVTRSCCLEDLSCHGAQCLGDAKSVRALKVAGVSVGKDVEVAARDGVLGRMCEKLDGFS